MKLLACAALTAVLGGCTSIEAPTVRPWEGRYETKAAAAEAVEKMDLKKGESVWMLSNATMKRLIKETKE